jgi:hypothetical protein
LDRRHKPNFAAVCEGIKLAFPAMINSALTEGDRMADPKRSNETERYIEYGETAVKLALLLVAIGLGGSFAVFMLAVTIKMTDRMLGLGLFQH